MLQNDLLCHLREIPYQIDTPSEIYVSNFKCCFQTISVRIEEEKSKKKKKNQYTHVVRFARNLNGRTKRYYTTQCTIMSLYGSTTRFALLPPCSYSRYFTETFTYYYRYLYLSRTGENVADMLLQALHILLLHASRRLPVDLPPPS